MAHHKFSMTSEFPILPWEHRASGAATTAGAQCALEIGGRKRQFTLRMREGVIYFKAAEGAPLWAVTRVFERDLAGDELIQAWKSELARANYGRYLVYRPFLFDLKTSSGGVQTAMGIVHRADYSGWAREWFDSHWLDVPAHRDGKTLDVWGNQFEKATRRTLHHAHRAFLDRALPEDMRRPIETRWVRGSEAELQRVFALALRLFVRDDDLARIPTRANWAFMASNPADAGGWGTLAPSSHYNKPLRYAPVWNDLLKLVERHFVLAGMSWKHGAPSRARNDFEVSQREKWGRDWRGDWDIETPKVSLAAKPLAHLSAHEKLEDSLALRKWLRDKISPRVINNWLNKTLD